MRFSKRTGCDVGQVMSVIEWGGGYGNMAKIFRRLRPLPTTYIVIDTPRLSCVQLLYLATILGTENVHLVDGPHQEFAAGSINCLPLCFLNDLDLNTDLFISTWALSESSRYSQEHVSERAWFNAKDLLLAYQGSSKVFPHADQVGKMAEASGAMIDQIEFLPGNYYACV